MRERLIWSLAVFVSTVKATTFTVPKVVILGDVVLTTDWSFCTYYAKIHKLR